MEENNFAVSIPVPAQLLSQSWQLKCKRSRAGTQEVTEGADVLMLQQNTLLKMQKEQEGVKPAQMEMVSFRWAHPERVFAKMVQKRNKRFINTNQ